MLLVRGLIKDYSGVEMTDKIKESLQQSSQNIARKIALLTKEKQAVEEKLNEFTNSITMMEAKIAVLHDEKQELHEILSDKKKTKNNLYSKRDRLIAEKRSVQDQAYHQPDSGDLRVTVDKLSDQIGAVIEESKALTEEMQEIYEQTQDKQHEIKELQDELYRRKNESQEAARTYEKKLTDMDHELNRLRRKMRAISSKLSE